MKKFEVINLSNIIQVIENETSLVGLKEFNYALIKNKFKIKPLIEEIQHLFKSFADKNPKKQDISDKDYNEFLNKLVNESEEYKTLINEDSEFIPYTIKLDNLEGKEFDLRAANTLIELGIIVE